MNRFAGIRAVMGLVALLFLTGEVVSHAQPNQPAAIAVVDVREGERPTSGWTSGLADLLELELQKRGVATIERRQIQLLLGEKALIADGLTIGNVRATQIPSVRFLVAPELRKLTPTDFELTCSLVHAKSATVEAVFTESGLYPGQLSLVMERLANRIADALPGLGLPKRETREFQTLTWVPEAALPFFKGIECFAANDVPVAIAYFARARAMDRNFIHAALWEARSYDRAGFPQFAGFIRNKIPSNQIPKEVIATNLPVLAVVGRAYQPKQKSAPVF